MAGTGSSMGKRVLCSYAHVFSVVTLGLLLLLAAPGAIGQENLPDEAGETLPLLTIQDVLEDRDQNTVPDRIDEMVRVRGVVTLPTGLLSDEYFQAVVQDSTGGIALFDYDLSTTLSRGTVVEVTGKVNQYRGAVQIFKPVVDPVGTSNIPPARSVPLTEANEWDYYGQRVRVQGTLGTIESGTFATAPLRSSGESLKLFFPAQVARTFPFSDFPEGSHVEAMGVVSIYKQSWPYDDGFQLIITSPDDLTILTLPPPPWQQYLSEAIIAGTAVIALTLLVIYIQHKRQRDRQRELAAVNAISSAIGTPSIGVGELLRQSCETITAQGLADAILIHVLEENRVLRPRCWSGVDRETAEIFEYDMVRRTWDETIDRELEAVSSRASEIREELKSRHFDAHQLLPLPGRTGVVGVATVLSRSRKPPSARQQRMLHSAARLIGLGIDNLEMFRRAEADQQELQQLAITDDLTGLYNRRFLNEYVRIQVPMARRRDGRIGFLVVDLDHFKKVNDTWGHETGDQVLVRVAEIIRSSARASDLPVRWGGEEFLVVLSDTTVEGAEKFADRLAREIRTSRFTDIAPETALSVSASIGIALYPDHGENIDQVLRACDEALYRAKREGRDRIVTAQRSAGFMSE